jgi:hypothetical protein
MLMRLRLASASAFCAKYPPSTLTRNFLSASFFAPWATNTFVVGARPAQRAGRYNGFAKFLFFETFGKAIYASLIFLN